MPRKFSEKHDNVDKKEEEKAYQLISATSPEEMEATIRNTPYEKYYLDLGPDLNIACFGINYEGNKSLKQ